jgi:hypothetical protein
VTVMRQATATRMEDIGQHDSAVPTLVTHVTEVFAGPELLCDANLLPLAAMQPSEHARRRASPPDPGCRRRYSSTQPVPWYSR